MRCRPQLEALEDRCLPSTLPVPSTLTVTNNADSGAGSLRAEIAAANPGDTINFASSLEGQTITLKSGELNVAKNLTIHGLGADKLTISGDGSSRVFDISNNANVTLTELTITDGQVVGDNGGGILNESGATLTLNQVVMTNNQAKADDLGNGGSGGGVESAGSLTVTQSDFSGNVASLNADPVADSGGAIDSNGPSLTVTNSTFSHNQAAGTSTGDGAGVGGAINSTSTTATVANSTFTGNTASGRIANGGAISQENGLMTISYCTFTSNQAVGADGTNDLTFRDGGEALGGAVINSAPLTITNSAFSDNLAKGGDGGDDSSDGVDGGGFVGVATGGGVCNFFSTLTVSNSVFTDNRAIGGNSAVGPGGDAAGGGVLGAGFASNTLTNVRFVGNQAIGGGGGQVPREAGGSAAAFTTASIRPPRSRTSCSALTRPSAASAGREPAVAPARAAPWRTAAVSASWSSPPLALVPTIRLSPSTTAR
jgi:hypothetical protein